MTRPLDFGRTTRYEVWHIWWHLYRVCEVKDGGPASNLLGPQRYPIATVWGRIRACNRANRLQHAHDHPPTPPNPIYQTRTKP